jgi:DNA-binding transcriptional ArsR family regulator
MAEHAAHDTGHDPFAALGDPHRRSIVELLAGGERSVGDIAERLPISRPAVSRHLRLLEAAGLVAHRAEGNRRVYRLDRAGADAMAAYMDALWGEALARYRIAVENTRDGR